MGSIDVPSYSKKANCIQYLFCRPFIAGFYSFVIMFAYIFYGFILGFMGFMNCFTVVCTGKYSEGYYDMYVRILEWNAKFGMYAAGLTKESPEFCP